MASLRAGLEDALRGRARISMLAGEAGIGKTRIAEELAGFSKGRGARVFWGRCHEGDWVPAYWPWRQIVRGHLEKREAGRGAAKGKPLPKEIAPILLEPSSRRSDSSGKDTRFRVFEAMAGFLRQRASEAPLVLVLDDLHWADKSSLLLLRFLARELGETRIFVLGTYRDELGPGHPLREALADATFERIFLQGLGAADVQRFIEDSVGVSVPRRLAAGIHEQTGGNPFFVTELLGFLARERPGGLGELEPSELAIPQSVRELIRRRLEPLDSDCHAVLSLASAIGVEFDTASLQRASGLVPERFMELLERAISVAIVQPVEGAIGRYAFSHALVRRTIYDMLTPLRRIEIHRRLGDALETLAAPHAGERAAELAYHFLEAAPGGGPDKAIAYAVRAGEHALARVAYEEAAGHYARALQALGFREPDERRRCELLVALGDAQMRAGDSVQAKNTLRQAGALAKELAAPDLLAEAALGFGWWVEPGRTDHLLVELLESAREALGEEDSALRARVLAHLAAELWYSGTSERRAKLSEEAVAVARRIGDKRALTHALSARHIALWGPENVEERLEVASEVVRLATDLEDTERALQGRVWQVVDSLELGDIQSTDVSIAVCARLAGELRQPGYLWWTTVFHGMRALLEGHFDRAEERIHEALAIGQRAQTENALQVFSTQMFLLRREQGRLAELEPAFKGMVEEYPDIPSWRCGLALLYAQVGREEEARKEFERLAKNDFRDLPKDLFWLIGVGLLAQVCTFLGDVPRAALLYQALLPYARRTIVVGRAVVCAGSAAEYLGLLASTMGRFDAAERHFTDALEMNASLGGRPFTAYTLYEYSRMLLARGRAGDRRKAAEVAERALDTARELGMGFLITKLTELLEQPIEGTGAEGPADGGAEPTVAVLRKEGRSWAVAYGATRFRLKDTRGLGYIVELLRHPNRDLHALELAAADPSSSSKLGDAGAHLDAAARAAYKTRLEDLRLDLSRAKESGDHEAAERLEDEVDFLTRELTRALGLGGRERRAGSAAERARLNVTRAIKASEKAIEAFCPHLARHLEGTIRTGMFCSYVPEAESPISWDL